MSNVKTQIEQDYIFERKAGNEEVYPVLSMLRAAIKQFEIDNRDKVADGTTDEQVTQILKSEAKKRKDSIESYAQANRDDLVKKEKAELEIIEKYLPEQLSEDIIRQTVKDKITSMNAGPQDMGKIMGAVMGELKSKGDVDGKLVTEIVKQELQ